MLPSFSIVYDNNNSQCPKRYITLTCTFPQSFSCPFSFYFGLSKFTIVLARHYIKVKDSFVPCSITTVVYFYTFGFYIPCLVTSTWCCIIYAQCSCVKLFYNKCKDIFTTCLLTKVFKLTKGCNKIFWERFLCYISVLAFVFVLS